MDSLNLYYETLRKTIKSLPNIKEITFVSGNIPFSSRTNESGLTFRGKHVQHLNNFTVEDYYQKVMNVTLLEGRWFDKEDVVGKNKSIIIDAALKEATFGKEPAVGKLLGNDDDKNKFKVVG
ncbi:ABC transporter permease [Mucilaginibacter metallidurans]|uniref:ABC transporter permease n=1 Tax=Mucilaginibacter sp. P4 TaxID=3383180 RepID=UPI00142EB1B2|nr:ABC transporter permease [Mucilaginibacter gossypii]